MQAHKADQTLAGRLHREQGLTGLILHPDQKIGGVAQIKRMRDGGGHPRHVEIIGQGRDARGVGMGRRAQHQAIGFETRRGVGTHHDDLQRRARPGAQNEKRGRPVVRTSPLEVSWSGSRNEGDPKA